MIRTFKAMQRVDSFTPTDNWANTRVSGDTNQKLFKSSQKLHLRVVSCKLGYCDKALLTYMMIRVSHNRTSFLSI